VIKVREYAHITYEEGHTTSLDLAEVSRPTFDWLLELQQRWKGDSPILALKSRKTIKLESYVGYLQSPTGEAIEVLPKIQQSEPIETDLSKCRVLLRRMLASALHIKPREADSADLIRSDMPMHEWVIEQFLTELAQLVRRGLRFDYTQIEEESRFIRGQLDMARQSRQTPDRATWFHIRHDIFSPDRIENRLLKTALGYAFKITKHPENWRLANELNHYLIDIKPCFHPQQDIKRWQRNKLMKPYEAIKPWCHLILERMNPDFQKGEHRGIAMLFPMEKLFENFVTVNLSKQTAPGVNSRPQASSEYLVTHLPTLESNEQKWFQLQPDLLLEAPTGSAILDMKWKLLEAAKNTAETKYGISQSDLYQLYSYGLKYMNGEGSMMLIYPKHEGFTTPLPVFRFDHKLIIWVVPFDLDDACLVQGEWAYSFDKFFVWEDVELRKTA
tara:strand:- start:5232 stop:6563 length:1332 start_codon:yes stop_codon:yes gene_type:complete